MLQRKNIWVCGLLAFLGIGLTPAHGDGFSFSYNAFGSPPGLILEGDAVLLQDRVRLTPSARSTNGGLWCDTKQPVGNGFETTFQFQITEPGGLAADGFAFVIQNGDAPRLGGKGGNVGVGGLSNAVAVKFDNYHWQHGQNGQIQILKYDALMVLAGDSPSDVLSSPNFPDPQAVASVTNGIAFSDGRIHTARIVYVPGNLRVFLDDLEAPLVTAPVNLDRVMDLDNGRAWIGFTAATGADSQNHDIIAWSFVSSSGNGSGAGGNQVSSNSGLLEAGTATINGQTLSLSHNGLGSLSELMFQGDAGLLWDRVRLTPSVRSKAGGLWHGAKQFIQEGFETTFQFQITEPTGFGADGLAFVIQNSDIPRLGEKGGNIGFGGITNAVAVKFDNYHYGGIPEQPGPRQILKFDEVGVQAGGPGNVVRVSNYHPDIDSIASVTNGATFSDGRVHAVKIVYTPGNLRVFLDSFQTPLVSVDVDLSKVMDLDNGRAWVGFTAATGTDSQNHDLLAWSFVSSGDTNRLETNTVTTDGQALTAQQDSARFGSSASVQPAGVGTVPVSPAPEAGGKSTAATQGTSNAGRVSILGTWETTIKGADKGFMILTFSDDFTLRGYGLRLGITNLFTVTGDWRRESAESVTGHWWENMGALDSAYGTFSGRSFVGPKLVIEASSASGLSFSWVARPAADYPDVSGTWDLAIDGTYPAGTVRLQLLPFVIETETYPGVFEVAGDGRGQLMISSRNHVYGSIRSSSGVSASFSGRFSPVTLTLRLNGVQEDGLEFSATATKE